MKTMHTIVFSGLAGKTAKLASELASVARNLIMDVRDCYRPGLHYMRGPGPETAGQVLRQRRMRPDL
jgi:hypothetical protein